MVTIEEGGTKPFIFILTELPDNLDAEGDCEELEQSSFNEENS